MSEERNMIPLILTGIGTIIGTVGCLWYYGYLHFAKPEDALLLSDFTMLKTVPGEDYKISLTPAAQVAQCVDGVLVMFDTEQKGLSGVLVNNKKQAVRCMGQETPQLQQWLDAHALQIAGTLAPQSPLTGQSAWLTNPLETASAGESRCRLVRSLNGWKWQGRRRAWTCTRNAMRSGRNGSLKSCSNRRSLSRWATKRAKGRSRFEGKKNHRFRWFFWVHQSIS